LILLGALLLGGSGAAPDAARPNVILIMTDDQGYGDLGCYGHPVIRTPHIDRLAKEGVRLTRFYAGGCVCTPSRAALMTGCEPRAVGLEKHVIFPNQTRGLHPDEVTIAEICKGAGYATACFGKWHLGNAPPLLPVDQGFDEWFGIPYSNDMSAKEQAIRGRADYPHSLPVMRGHEVLEWEPDQSSFTRDFTEGAIDFVRAHASERFFVYLPHPMPHIPLYTGAPGESNAGLYADVIEEIDAGIGRLLDTLDDLEIADDTLVIFTSDNGPWLPFKAHGGSAGPLRDGKGTVFEGGIRVPCVMRWPNGLDAGRRVDDAISMIDILPTIAGLVGVAPPDVVDGVDVLRTLRGGAGPERLLRFDQARGERGAMIRGRWKYHVVSGELYDLHVDPGEKWNVADAHPGIVEAFGRDLETWNVLESRQVGASR
ncbi:MAG: sulfatase, partial [Phycisphaerales bacterium]|nr:sulfatase [Phycisphaerales bacterium]